VKSKVDGKLVPFPINRTTLNMLYGLDLDEAGVQTFFERVREPRHHVRTSEDLVLNAVGRDLYLKFFWGYTRKQWGLDPSELSASVAGRIAFRTNDDDRYFTDKFQAMPAQGYTSMFERILDHAKIEVDVGRDFNPEHDPSRVGHIIYTGRIDAYFDYRLGRLAYRSLRFEHEHMCGVKQFLPVGTVNYPNEFAFTRISEFKHLTGQEHSGTTIAREYPQADGEPYYPVPTLQNQALYKRYEALASEGKGVTFVGRLAQYRYYDMDQAVAAALKGADTILGRSVCEGD
jgi:UDP-galactopyranose mutase